MTGAGTVYTVPSLYRLALLPGFRVWSKAGGAIIHEYRYSSNSTFEGKKGACARKGWTLILWRLSVRSGLAGVTGLPFLGPSLRLRPSPQGAERMDAPPAFSGESAHGASENLSWREILKKHMYDWLALILLAVGLVFLDTLGRPFHRYVLPEELRQLRYPLLANSVPALAIPAYTLLLPLVVFGVFFAVKRDKRDLHNAFMGLMACLILTSVATDSVKLAAGRLRPDFSSRCFPNGQEVSARFARMLGEWNLQLECLEEVVGQRGGDSDTFHGLLKVVCFGGFCLAEPRLAKRLTLKVAVSTRRHLKRTTRSNGVHSILSLGFLNSNLKGFHSGL